MMRTTLESAARDARVRIQACAATVLLLSTGAAAQTTTPAGQDTPRPRGGVRFAFDDRPVLRVGDAVRVELGARFEADIRADDASALDTGALTWGGRRVGVEGQITRRVAFDVSHELGDDRPWRDAFVEVTASRLISVRGGRFKVPFSYERLRGAGRLDFVHRSYAADRLAPGRQNGAIVQGRVRRHVGYAAGLFGAGLPEDAELDPAARDVPRRPLWAGRVTARPFRDVGDRSSLLRSMQVGLSALRGRSVPMLTTLDARTIDARDRIFPAVYVSGPRTGIGAEAQWSTGPLTLNAEWMQLRESRDGQGLGGETLPALVARGWYVSAMYRIVRWRQDDAHWLAALLLRDLEVGARVEGISFQSGTGADAAGPVHPRVAIVPAHALRALTLGASWRLNQFGRILGNLVAEEPDAPDSAGLDNARRWSSVIRLQLQF